MNENDSVVTLFKTQFDNKTSQSPNRIISNDVYNKLISLFELMDILRGTNTDDISIIVDTEKKSEKDSEQNVRTAENNYKKNIKNACDKLSKICNFDTISFEKLIYIIYPNNIRDSEIFLVELVKNFDIQLTEKKLLNIRSYIWNLSNVFRSYGQIPPSNNVF